MTAGEKWRRENPLAMARAAHGHTIADAALAAGISVRAVKYAESGGSRLWPHPDTMREIARYAGISIVDLALAWKAWQEGRPGNPKEVIS